MKKLNPNLLYESIGGIDETLFAECEGENAAGDRRFQSPQKAAARRASAGAWRLPPPVSALPWAPSPRCPFSGGTTLRPGTALSTTPYRGA